MSLELLASDASKFGGASSTISPAVVQLLMKLNVLFFGPNNIVPA